MLVKAAPGDEQVAKPQPETTDDRDHRHINITITKMD